MGLFQFVAVTSTDYKTKANNRKSYFKIIIKITIS